MGREGWVLIVKSHECQKKSSKGKMEEQKRHERYEKQKSKSKYINNNLNVNILNKPIKGQRLTET